MNKQTYIAWIFGGGAAHNGRAYIRVRLQPGATPIDAEWTHGRERTMRDLIAGWAEEDAERRAARAQRLPAAPRRPSDVRPAPLSDEELAAAGPGVYNRD